jgi:hypothetical protein
VLLALGGRHWRRRCSRRSRQQRFCLNLEDIQWRNFGGGSRSALRLGDSGRSGVDLGAECHRHII